MLREHAEAGGERVERDARAHFASWEHAELERRLSALVLDARAPARPLISAREVEAFGLTQHCPCVPDAELGKESIARFAARSGAAAFPHRAGAPFIHHLYGTYQTLLHWGAPRDVCVAGFLHSAYTTDAYPLALFAFHQRPLLGWIAGEAAELLVFLFCTLDRRAAWRGLLGEEPTAPGELRVCNRLTDESLTLRGSVLGAYALMELANQHEQTGYEQPTPYLTDMARILVRFVEGALPGGRSGLEALANLGREDEARALADYGRACAGNEDALEAAELAARALSCVPEPQLAVARLAHARGRAELAREAARRALELLEAWGAPWDKRRAWTALQAEAQALAAGRSGESP